METEVLNVFPEGAHLKTPVSLRPGTTDYDVYDQVFEKNCYNFNCGMPKPGSWIFDGGAYTGISTRWFHLRYPLCNIMAIEPDPKNYALLVDNTREFYPHVETFNSAIWHKRAVLRPRFAPSREWNRRFHEAEASRNGGIAGLPLTDWLPASMKAFILKLDIEGEEGQIFTSPESVSQWCGRVENLLMEIHSRSVIRKTKSVMSQLGWEWEQKGEIWHFRRREDADRT